MSAKDSILRAHASMAAVLDVKLKDMPEWQAFRDIDAALRDIAEASERRPQAAKKAGGRPKKSRTDSQATYLDLAEKALESTGQPIITNSLVEFIGRHRTLNKDPKKAKINVTSALSHSDTIKSIPWQGGSAWWWAEKPVPLPTPWTMNDGKAT